MQECPTCSQPIDFQFIQERYDEHNEEQTNAELFIFQEERRRIIREEDENKIHRQSTRGVKEWETYRSIDTSLPSAS